jgi:hypothetical protein
VRNYWGGEKGIAAAMGGMGEALMAMEFMGGGARAPGDWTAILDVHTMLGHAALILERGGVVR